MSKNGKKVNIKPQKVKKPKRVTVDPYRDPDKERFTSLFRRHNPAATGGQS